MAKRKKQQKTRVIVRRARDALTADERGITSLLVGGIAGFLLNTEMVKQSEWLRKHWYALPIAMLLVGYMLARRRNPHGKTLMALGAYLFMNNFMNRPKEEESPDVQGPGWDLLQHGGQWVVTPDGQRVLMPAGQWQQYAKDTAAPALSQGRRDGVNQVVEDVYSRG